LDEEIQRRNHVHDVVEMEGDAVTPKKIALYVGTTCALLILIWTVIFISAAKSEPFEQVALFTKQSPEVHQVVGDVSSVTLAFLKSFSFNYSDVQGVAQFQCNVVGTHGKAILHIKLEKNVGKWHIVAARLNESPLLKLE